MNSAKQYDLGHLPIPQYDDESADARLLVGDDGTMYTAVLFYNAEDYTDPRSTITITRLTEGQGDGEPTLYAEYREAEYGDDYSAIAREAFDGAITGICMLGHGSGLLRVEDSATV